MKTLNNGEHHTPEWWAVLVQIWAECADDPVLLLGLIAIVYLCFLALTR